MLIGICGKKRAGKSTAADYLCTTYGFIDITWADPLKLACMSLFSLPARHFYGDTEDKEEFIPEWNMSGRRILQLVGTEMFRHQVCEDFWVRRGVREINSAALYGAEHVVMSDCRFPNEMKAIKELGGSTLRVIRSGFVAEDDHESENALNDYVCDYTVDSHNEIKKLYKELDKYIQSVAR